MISTNTTPRAPKMDPYRTGLLTDGTGFRVTLMRESQSVTSEKFKGILYEFQYVMMIYQFIFMYDSQAQFYSFSA